MGRKSREQIEQEAAGRAAAMTQSPEFQAAVAVSVQAALADILPKLQGAHVAAGTAPQGDTADFANQLAMAISQLTDQGTGRSRVAPEIMASRQKARERMINLLIEARAEGKTASYRLKNKIHLDERIIEPVWIDAHHTARPTEIDFPGVPNEAMTPINDVAKAIYAAFMESIGSVVPGKGVDGHGLPGIETLAVTPKGVVVRNGAVSRTMAAKAVVSEGPMQSAYEAEAPHVNGAGPEPTVTIHHEGQPGRYKDVAILGTIQPRARQSI
jgi:hypothetical protein